MHAAAQAVLCLNWGLGIPTDNAWCVHVQLCAHANGAGCRGFGEAGLFDGAGYQGRLAVVASSGAAHALGKGSALAQQIVLVAAGLEHACMHVW